jgi:small subunit ribosomal protein S20
MANIKSAKKRIRQTKKLSLKNLRIRREIKQLAKEITSLAGEGKKEEAQDKFKLATKKLDKAAKTNLIHKNTAARYKSRLAKRINKAEKAPKAKPRKRSKRKSTRKKPSKRKKK